MRIQDIITGDVGSHNESALAEIIRVAKLQGREKKDEAISPTIFIATATIYTTVLYSDMLHGLDLEQELIENLLIRTLVVLVFVGIFLLVARKIEVKTSK